MYIYVVRCMGTLHICWIFPEQFVLYICRKIMGQFQNFLAHIWYCTAKNEHHVIPKIWTRNVCIIHNHSIMKVANIYSTVEDIIQQKWNCSVSQRTVPCFSSFQFKIWSLFSDQHLFAAFGPPRVATLVIVFSETARIKTPVHLLILFSILLIFCLPFTFRFYFYFLF